MRDFRDGQFLSHLVQNLRMRQKLPVPFFSFFKNASERFFKIYKNFHYY